MEARALCKVALGFLVIIAFGADLNAQAAIPWEEVGQVGLGVVGGVAGAAVAIAFISEVTPQINSAWGSTAAVIGSLTVCDGLGAAAGVLLAGKMWESEGNVGGCFLGGLAGGLVSAFTEPLLYVIGIPENVTEFLGMALLPILPAIGAYVGYHWRQ